MVSTVFRHPPLRLLRNHPGAVLGITLAAGSIVLAPALQLHASAQELFIYPAGGQSPEQQRRDTQECRQWAIDQTGFDPAAPGPDATASTPPVPQVQAQGPGVARSTARGAVVGTAGGAIMGNTGRGALAGAAGGALMGAGRQLDQRRAQQQATEDWARQQQIREAERQQLLQYRRQTYNRAVTACMEGRGYTVS
jgi:hypothetical protein